MLILLLCCMTKPKPLPEPRVDITPYRSKINWQQAGEEAALLLSEYIRVDTTNPPGNEMEGANFLAGVLEKEGIPYEIYESSPNRANLIARVEGNGDKSPLCLLSHIDVVTADHEKWDYDPLSGHIDEEGVVWGRGALDMKGMGVLELLTLVWLKRLEVPLNRDVILLAVADEEVSGQGIQYIRDNHWENIECSHVINEGGLGLKDLLFEGQTVYPISVGEKGSVWLKMIATGEPGHGSTPRPNEAPKYLLDAIEVLDKRDINAELNPVMQNFFTNIGDHKKGISGIVMRQPLLRDLLVKPKLLKNPLTRAAMINTVHVTGLGGENEPNVVPSEVYAILDCRIQPGVDPQQFIAYLQAMVGPNIRFEVLSTSSGHISSWDDPVYYALMRYATEGESASVAGPVISVGYTDSNYLRPIGVQAYGFVPFVLTDEEIKGFHGHNERISTQNMQDGLRKLFSTVLEVSMQ
jgi:acetylornithine deacetylase/succinyl-diaminopimelate desuccinylase-like protein